MDTVYISFANSRNEAEKLHTLASEDEEVFKILSEEKAKDPGKVDVIRESFATVRKLLFTLPTYQHLLTIFLFSGHAGRDRLLLEDQDAQANGLAGLLEQCPNLKLVILNGCSTKGQVEQLLAAGVPVVIATSAPVKDSSATEFSIGFFRSFAKMSNNVDEAFKAGIAAAKTLRGPIEHHRGIKVPGARPSQPCWGLYYKPENEFLLTQWRLGESDFIPEDFIPNELLLEATWEAIKPFIDTAEELDNYRRNDKIDKIITELPHLVSDYLRKLIATKRQGEKDEFYNELGSNRLKYLVYTYTNCIELLCFTLMAQLWDELSKGSLQKITPSLHQELDRFFKCQLLERLNYSLLSLIRELRICFDENRISYFIEEFSDLSKNFNERTALYDACQFIESVRDDIAERDHINDTKARKLCIDLERHLTVIMRQLGFLAKYKMTSMKGINFIKYKHQKRPKYRHNFVELRYRPSGMNIESETLVDSMDNASVVFIHEKEKGKFSYLNLSPFIIDVNSFDEKAQLADLALFLGYQAEAKSFFYRYIYKPAGGPLRVDPSRAYAEIIAEQFNAFYQLIFKQALQQ